MTFTREAPVLTPDAFEARFSDLVELICDAAQLGHPKPFMEAQYTLLRAWMQDEFPQLAAVFSGTIQAEFESLYQPESLAGLLALDSGALLTRLIDTQEAIAAWKNTQAN
jgi:hypothetical protein